MTYKYEYNPLLSQGFQKLYQGYEEYTKDPSGFVYPDDITVSYDSVARTITLTAAAGKLLCLCRGEVISGLDEKATTWTSSPHANVLGQNYFLHYENGAFVFDTTPWRFDCVQIAFVQYFGAYKFALKETHNLMPWTCHKEFHETVGTYLQSGGDLSAFVLSSTTAANKRPNISSTTVQDEDLATILPTLTSKLYCQRFLSGAGATKNLSVDQNDIIPLSGNHPYYNQFTGGVWQQTLMTNNNYAAIFVIAKPVSSDSDSQKYRYIFVQPQQESASLTTIQALTPASLVSGDTTGLVTEYVHIGKIIIQRVGGGTPNWQIISVEKLTGTRVSQISNISSGYLSTVSVDNDTIEGDGTSGSPLKIKRSLVGTSASPSLIVGGTGLTGLVSAYDTIAFISGSGGPANVTANPAITNGSFIGQRLTLIGKSDSDTITLNDGNGLNLNGAIILKNFSTIELFWDGTVWCELSRRE